MRLRIILKPQDSTYEIPSHYQYPLSASIYKIFNSSSAEFTEFLHNNGYIASNGKPYKLFNFSNLILKNFNISQGLITGSDNVHFYFSTPLKDSILEHLIRGFMITNFINIANDLVSSKFKVIKVVKLKEPSFSNYMYFKALTPITVSQKKIYNGKNSIHYIKPSEDNFEQLIKNNLLNKYELIHKKPYKSNFKLEIDKNYIDAYQERHYSKLVKIKENRPDEMSIKGYAVPIMIRAENPEIIKTAYDTGIGEKNSLGFGMLKPVI